MERRRDDMGLLDLKNVTYSYSGSDDIVLDEISLSVKQGSFTVLIGESGSGKSTLLRLIKKSVAPAGRMSGEIIYQGKDCTKYDAKTLVSEIGFVGQNPDNQIVTDKVWHELSFGLESLGLPNQEIRRRVAEMAEYFGIASWYERDVATLSGGQKQILNLAAVMVLQPKLLLLDEPTAQLDPMASKRFLDTLFNINRELGTTIICVEHNLEQVMSICDSCIALKQGKVLTMGTPVEVSKFLLNNGEELAQGLPSATRIYSLLSDNIGDDLPLSVRDGKKWMAGKAFEKKEIVESSLKESDIALEARDVTFAYKKNEGDVLKRLSFNVHKGEMAAVLGGNGCGKSTLLKLFAGVVKPSHGKLKRYGKVIMLPQNPMAMFTEISVEEELGEVLLNTDAGAGLSLAEKKEVVERMLDRLGMSSIRKHHPYDLSGGQQQKLAIGKVLLMKPDVLLLDEPTKGIDPYFKRQLGEWLKEIQKEGVTILLVSHDVEFAAEYVDRCALLFDGEIASEGYVKTFFDKNMFFTTGVNRIMSDYFKCCVCIDDVKNLIK